MTATGYWLVALSVPLALVIYWNIAQQSFPRQDAADYLLSTQRLYDAVEKETAQNVLRALYFERHQRGIIGPALSLPFVVLTDGELLRAVAIKAVVFFAVFLTYTYLLARELATRRRAVFWTIFVGTIPFVVTLGTGRSELGEGCFSVAAAACLYHGVRSRLFGSLRHTLLIGVWFGLGACCRPLEAIVLGVTGVAVFVPAALRRGHLRSRDMAVAAPLVAFAAVLLLQMALQGESRVPEDSSWHAIVVVLAAAIAAALAAGRLGLSLPFFAGLGAGLSIVLVWWLPYARSVYIWWRYGMAGEGDAQDRSSFELATIAVRLLPDVFPYALIILFVWALVTRFTVDDSERSRPSRLMVVYLVATALAAIGAGLCASLADPRFFLGGGLALAWLTFIVLPNGSRWVERILTAGALLQVGAICCVLFDLGSGAKSAFGLLVPLNVANENPLRLFPDADPQRDLFDAIARELPSRGAGTVAVLPNASDLDLQLDGQVLSLIGGKQWRFETPWVPPNTRLELATLRNYEHVVIGPIEGSVSPWWRSQSRAGVGLAREWSLGNLHEVGFSFTSMFKIRRPYGLDGTYLILKPRPQDVREPRAQAGEQRVSTKALLQ